MSSRRQQGPRMCIECKKHEGLTRFARDSRNLCVRCTNLRNQNKFGMLKHKKRARGHGLARKFNLTHEQYDILFDEQGGRCAICGTNTPGAGKKYLSVDHNHKTGAVRGLLCYKCNLGIGYLTDDYWVVQKAADYLLDADSLVIEEVG